MSGVVVPILILASGQFWGVPIEDPKSVLTTTHFKRLNEAPMIIMEYKLKSDRGC